MNREEYDIKIQDKKYSLQQQKDRFVAYYHIGKSYIKSLEQRIVELESRNIMKQSSNDIYASQVNDLLKHIAELEASNTCDGCEYYDENIFYRKGNDCRECSRYMTDYYEPKE